MGEINRRFFDSRMADKRLSLRGLAARMEMNHSQLSLTFSGARRAQLDECAKLADILGVPLYEVIEAFGVPVQGAGGRRVPVIGAVHGDGTVDLYGIPQGGGVVGTAQSTIIERTSAPDGLPDEAAAIQFRTAGTPLDWLDGAVSFFRRPSGIASDAYGRLCLAQVKDGPAAVGMIRRGYRDGTWNISGPHQRENAALAWATPLLLTRH